MGQKKPSKSLKKCKAIGKNKVLANLRGDLLNAENIFIIGPWIDTFFIEEIKISLPKSATARVLTRLANTKDEENIVTYNALKILKSFVSTFEARSLSTVHSKVIIINKSIVYLGSTNWYKYSLEVAPEITLRCPIEFISGLDRIIDEYWNKGSEINFSAIIDGNSTKNEINYEVIDPLAQQALKNNPKAYIKKMKK